MAKILIVDDSPLILAFLEEALRSWGHEVFRASDGYSVVPTFNKCNPDLIMLDYNMPASSGLEVYERIRTLYAGQRIPIIFLSATSRFELEMVIPFSEFVRCCDKPVDLEGLRTNINEMLVAAGIALPPASGAP
ncbi:MAG TPA: hypothetical protein DCZ01_08125 [Elusimicrobia bacterium]|nr:MAG: hypothetical protein A2X37_06880 [Elusimicrobia bacterium GWA2_66_18]OGR72864.1 MAG: hypothetical protein A2X40_06265 [Elusimicrobia bacterium GWC2_65_9]HAZ08471.1 hypothetical protein [Elusimicrobiota bacterium]